MDWKEEARQRAARAKARAEAEKAAAAAGQSTPAKPKPAPTTKPYEPPRETNPYEPPRETNPYELPRETKTYEPNPYAAKSYESPRGAKPYSPVTYESPEEPAPYEPPRVPTSHDAPRGMGELAGDDSAADSSADEEELRQAQMWQQGSGSVSLEGYVASPLQPMGPSEFRPAAARWFSSFIHGTPFARQERGFRFVLRKDDVLGWECNVVVYGEIMGGHIHRDNKVRVTGVWNGSTHDLYASRIVTMSGPMRSEMSIRGQVHGRTVRAVTIALGLLALMLLLAIGQTVLGITIMGGTFFGNLFAYLRSNWIALVLALGLIVYLWRRVRGWFRRTFRIRRR